jgi:transposase
MARPPEVFVRPITMVEGRKLQRIGRTAKEPVTLRRAIVVLMSAQGQPAADIAHLMRVSADYVRGVIHAFNERGFEALDPKWGGGPRRRISNETRARIVTIAWCDPRFLAQPFSTWSLAKLCDYLITARIVEAISRETLRQILAEGGVSWQAMKTWKTSNDSDFHDKLARVLDLYDHPPADGRVICVDEFGPLNLQPRAGKVWRPVGRSRRLRATYSRCDGVRHMLAALDLATGKIFYRIKDRKRSREFLGLLKALRARWPGQKLYLIADNFSTHKHPTITAWCTTNQVEMVFLPTYASWLNWIECEFAALRYFALNGTDHRSHHEQDTAIGDYIRWRNHHARPKTAFAPNSRIREPGYTIKAA